MFNRSYDVEIVGGPDCGRVIVVDPATGGYLEVESPATIYPNRNEVGRIVPIYRSPTTNRLVIDGWLTADA